MKGRITLAVVSLFLAYLGADDVYVWMRNPEPQVLASPAEAASREWLEFRDAVLDLEGAISTTGTVELEALLVPLRGASPQAGPLKAFLETRDPRRLELFRQLHFGQDSPAQQEAFRRQHAEALAARQSVRGLRLRGLVAAGNARKMRQLARDSGFQVAPDVVFLVEGQEPPRWRGLFFLLVGVAGLVKAAADLWRKPARPATAP